MAHSVGPSQGSSKFFESTLSLHFSRVDNYGHIFARRFQDRTGKEVDLDREALEFKGSVVLNLYPPRKDAGFSDQVWKVAQHLIRLYKEADMCTCATPVNYLYYSIPVFNPHIREKIIELNQVVAQVMNIK